jgi:peptidyl-tRNA hydrolase, PTH1 family
MLLIAGLGNPGKEYENTPHNIGRLSVGGFGLSLGIASFSSEAKFKGLAAHAVHGEEKINLLLPETFMNLSGDAVAAVANFYKIEAKDIWVVHDDADLDAGKIRISLGGGSAGHKGVESVAEKLGTKEFWRMRIGIGKDPVLPLDSYVLKPGALSEETVSGIKSRTSELLTLALDKGIAEAAKLSD